VNFYRHYLGDYTRKTGHLSLAENGAYRRLLDHYYATGKSLPADQDALCRICGALSAQEQKAVGRVADEFFPVNGDGTRHNKRADEELNAYSTQADTNRRIAVEREAKRRENEPTTNRATSRARNANLSQKLEVRSQKLEVVSQKPERSKAEARATRLPSDWALPLEWGSWAVQERGWSAAQVHAVAENFRDHWIAAPGSKGLKLDWAATWRNWVRREKSAPASGGNANSVAEAKRRIFGDEHEAN
jgi:uncharacterized protein YdaU (DUF1376 family)